MFVISQSPTYRWPVSFETAADGGKFQKHSFTAVFKRLQQSELETVFSAEGITDKSAAKSILVGWQDVKDEAGQEIDFTSATADQLLDIPGVASAIVAAYLESIAGAKRKN